MIKFIKGEEKQLEELRANLFGMISEEGHELSGSPEDGCALKIDTNMFTDDQKKVIEACIYSRIQSGVLDKSQYEVDENIIQTTFALTADSNEKAEIIRTDILRGAKVADSQVVTLVQPWGPGMYNTLIFCIVAINLSSDQMKAIELSTKLAKGGIKITNVTKKISMVGSASANVVNRVSREVVLAGTEIGVTVGVGAVKTGVEAVAVATNIALRDLNPKELASGDNVQKLIGTVRGLWNNRNNDSKVVRGFGAL